MEYFYTTSFVTKLNSKDKVIKTKEVDNVLLLLHPS